MRIVAGERHAWQRQAVLAQHDMSDAVTAFGIKFFDPEFLDELAHPPHGVCSRDAGCRHGMVGDDDDLVGIENAGRRLMAAGDAKDDIEVDDEIEVRHHNVAGPDIGLPRMRGQNLFGDCMSHLPSSP